MQCLLIVAVLVLQVRMLCWASAPPPAYAQYEKHTQKYKDTYIAVLVLQVLQVSMLCIQLHLQRLPLGTVVGRVCRHGAASAFVLLYE